MLSLSRYVLLIGECILDLGAMVALYFFVEAIAAAFNVEIPQ